MTGAAAKAKHTTKAHIVGAFQKVGKSMAGFHGDVAVDGTRKQVSQRRMDGIAYSRISLRKSVLGLISCSTEDTQRTMAVWSVGSGRYAVGLWLTKYSISRKVGWYDWTYHPGAKKRYQRSPDDLLRSPDREERDIRPPHRRYRGNQEGQPLLQSRLCRRLMITGTRLDVPYSLRLGIRRRGGRSRLDTSIQDCSAADCRGEWGD